MKKEDIERFVGNQILLEKKPTGYRYIGFFRKINGDTIIFEDRKTGDTVIDIADISMMMRMREDVGK